jgi:uncharacterized protein DUF6194
MMTESEWASFLATLEQVQWVENMGYLFYFIGDDHRLPFATIGFADNDFDRISHLDRAGIFRINIGVRRETYAALFPGPVPLNADYAALNTFLPHPHYARQHYFCILNPVGANADMTRPLMVEAHALATERHRRTSDR